MMEKHDEQVSRESHFCGLNLNDNTSAGKLEALMKELGGMDVAEVKPFAGFS